MKPPDEIKKGLNVCGTLDGDCDNCAYAKYKVHCTDRLRQDALALIQQLEAKDVKQSHYIAELEKELKAVKRGRDAAVKDLQSHMECTFCKHDGTEADMDPCKTCFHVGGGGFSKRNWQWRGGCPENTEV